MPLREVTCLETKLGGTGKRVVCREDREHTARCVYAIRDRLRLEGMAVVS